MPFWLGWPGSELLGSSCVCPPVLGLQEHMPTPDVSHGRLIFKLSFSCLHSSLFNTLMSFFYKFVSYSFKQWLPRVSKHRKKRINQEICLCGNLQTLPNSLIKINSKSHWNSKSNYEFLKTSEIHKMKP